MHTKYDLKAVDGFDYRGGYQTYFFLFQILQNKKGLSLLEYNGFFYNNAFVRKQIKDNGGVSQFKTYF